MKYRHSFTLSFTSALDWVCDLLHAAAALPPQKKPYPLNRDWVGPKARLDVCEKIAPSPEFDPRTARPTESRSTNYAITAYHDIFVLYQYYIDFNTNH